MNALATPPLTDNLTLNITREIHVRASLETTFASLLEQLGPANESDNGPMPMKLEAWPGGRWFRDLGDGNGHFWASVQAIKRPTLLEFSGPLFMSYPVANNVQYRLTKVEGGTLISFRHSALGFVPDDARSRISGGWNQINQRVKQRAESAKSASATKKK